MNQDEKIDYDEFFSKLNDEEEARHAALLKKSREDAEILKQMTAKALEIIENTILPEFTKIYNAMNKSGRDGKIIRNSDNPIRIGATIDHSIKISCESRELEFVAQARQGAFIVYIKQPTTERMSIQTPAFGDVTCEYVEKLCKIYVTTFSKTQ